MPLTDSSSVALLASSVNAMEKPTRSTYMASVARKHAITIWCRGSTRQRRLVGSAAVGAPPAPPWCIPFMAMPMLPAIFRTSWRCRYRGTLKLPIRRFRSQTTRCLASVFQVPTVVHPCPHSRCMERAMESLQSPVLCLQSKHAQSEWEPRAPRPAAAAATGVPRPAGPRASEPSLTTSAL